MGSFEVTGFQAGCGVPNTWGQPRVLTKIKQGHKHKQILETTPSV